MLHSAPTYLYEKRVILMNLVKLRLPEEEYETEKNYDTSIKESGEMSVDIE